MGLCTRGDYLKGIRRITAQFERADRNSDISIRIIIKPLPIIHRNCISQNTFLDMWKKSYICPVHKKSDKQVINNYRPVSLLPVCGKVFERLMFNFVYEYLEEHKLLPADQSDF